MKELVCITCPLGCRLAIRSAGEEITVTGNRCSRGLAYAKEEFFTPRRVVTTTCRLVGGSRGDPDADGGPESPRTKGVPSPARRDVPALPRRVPCRTTAAFPRERVGELLELIHRTEVGVPVERGNVILGNALGTGIDVVATRRIP